jgi:hypothetical protein
MATQAVGQDNPNHQRRENVMEMREITANVKKSLIQAGFDKKNMSVRRDAGTARMWVNVLIGIDRPSDCYCGNPDQYGRVERCLSCANKISETRQKAYAIALKASGRESLPDYTQDILVQVWFNN